jgi:uncharacterized protein YndB with AHSA1/START domain
MTMQAVSAEPVRRTITVQRSVEDAFRLFTEGIDTWWPVATHSYAGEDVAETVLETRPGGRVYEVRKDGSQQDWAEVATWEPPERIVLAWKICEPTEVEVRFVAEGEGTRVELEHRGWERLNEEERARREGYSTGWAHVLDQFGSAAS